MVNYLMAQQQQKKTQPQAEYSTALRQSGNMKSDSTFIAEKKIGVIDRGNFRETENALTVDANYFKGNDNHGARPMVKEENEKTD